MTSDFNELVFGELNDKGRLEIQGWLHYGMRYVLVYDEPHGCWIGWLDGTIGWAPAMEGPGGRPALNEADVIQPDWLFESQIEAIQSIGEMDVKLPSGFPIMDECETQIAVS